MFRPSLFLLALAFSAAAMADDPQLYKWTDANGTIHYSDQAPARIAPDMTVAAMPVFPPVDPVKLAQQQAELLAQVAALQQLTEAQMAQQAQAAAVAQQQADLQAAQQAAQDQPSPVEPIYVSPAFVPRAYRANLYVPASHQLPAPHPRMTPPLHTRSPGAFSPKP
jgi:hypothetical protein